MDGGNLWAGIAFPLVPALRRRLIAAVCVVFASVFLLRALGLTTVLLVPVVFALITVIVCRWDEIMALIIIVGCILIDWYRLVDFSLLRFPILAPALSSLLIGVMLLSRTQERPWIPVPYLWLWGMLLVLVVAAIARAIPAYYSEAITFYGLQVFLTPLLLYVVGVQLGRDLPTVRRVLVLVSGFGALVAAHTILVAQTGIFLFSTQHEADYLGIKGDFVLTDTNTSRVGSFLLNPDWNGTFLMMMACISAGLFIASSSRGTRLIHAIELALILPALLFTYSLAALAATGCGFLVLILMAGRRRSVIGLLAVIGSAIVLIAVAFPTQLGVLQQHASAPREGALRLGAWLTALRVIAANSVSGIGLSQFTYLQRAEPYRVPQEFVQLSHPHESYLELAAMGGIPLLVTFLALVGVVLWTAVRACRGADMLHRPLLAGALAAFVGLAFNSLAINAWTLPPLAAIAWFIAGLLSSPSLTYADDTRSCPLNRSTVSSRYETTAKASL